MLHWMNKQGVRSDEGFEFQFTGRFSAEYRTYKRCITFELGDGGSIGGKFQIIFYRDGFDHWDGGNKISDDEQLEIIENVRKAVEFQGLDMDIE